MSLLVTSDILSSGTSDVEAVVKLLVASEAAGSRGGGRWRSIAVATLLWNANRNSYAIYQMVPFPMTLK